MTKPNKIGAQISLQAFDGLSLMVQGTTSDAGKSTLVAGLCRVLHRRGLSLAPFKPQNMALNSAVTADGGEIGRAQAVQAQACGLEPHIDFNPILLKPSSDQGAQVIVHGKALSNMQAGAYHDYKKVAMQAVLESHTRLRQNYRCVMVEGAGSPAEINLREGDIANMGFAEAVDCPVILIADIDRGGVFAHLVGTLDLLSETERARVVGFVINRFRGDIELLRDGLEWLETRTGIPVLGVLPYLKDWHLEAEDAIATEQVLGSQETLKVIVPVFPRISNHTDVDALRLHPQVDLEFVSLGQPLPPCDLVVLPGSKNVRADLASLRAAGWDSDLAKHMRYGGKLMGICGGMQMLGRCIADPQGIEGEVGESEGLAWLDITTVLEEEKVLRQRSGHLIGLATQGQKIAVKGYEIHQGQSQTNEQSLLSLDACEGAESESEGAISLDRQVLGSYLHGIFDQPEALSALLSWAGLQNVEEVDYHARTEADIDRLADCLEEHLDWPRLAQSLMSFKA